MIIRASSAQKIILRRNYLTMYSNSDEIVLGIGIGTTAICAGAWVTDHVEIIAESATSKTIPAYVSFNDVERIVGEPAKSQAVINPENTIYEFPRLIGRRIGSEIKKEELEMFRFKIEPDAKGIPLFVVQYQGETKKYTAEELTAMILEHVKNMANNYFQKPVRKAVLAVPACFNDTQRQAIKEAGVIAGLEVLRVINQPTASCVAYGLHKKKDPKIRNTIVIHVGGSRSSVTRYLIEDEIYEIINDSYDPNLGGNTLTMRLVEYCVNQFLKKEGIDIKNDFQALKQLEFGCEKAKKKLSSDKSAIQILV